MININTKVRRNIYGNRVMNKLQHFNKLTQLALRSYPFTTVSTEATLFLRNSAEIDDKGHTNIENMRQGKNKI